MKGVAIYHNIAIIKMPPVEVIFFKDEMGRVPVLDWLNILSPQIQTKAGARIKELSEEGYGLRRPKADYLRDGIYELRWRYQSVNCRILYFFNGRKAVVLAHGLTKEDKVPAIEIDRAVARKKFFEANPFRYGYVGRIA